MKKLTSFLFIFVLAYQFTAAQDFMKQYRKKQSRFAPAFGLQGGSIIGAHVQYYRGAVCATRTQPKAFFKQLSIDFRAGVEGYLPIMPKDYGGGKLKAGGIQTAISGLYHFMNTGSGEVSLYVGLGLQTGIRQFSITNPTRNTSEWNVGGVGRFGAEFLVKRFFLNRSKEMYLTFFVEGNMYSELAKHSPYSFIGGEAGIRFHTWHW